MKRLLLVDDHQIIREGLRMLLEDSTEFTVGGEAGDGDQALRLILEEPWDVVLLDVSMPGRNVFSVLERIRRAKPDLPVLILTMHDSRQMAVRLLKAGADGYLTKDCERDTLLDALRQVASGAKYLNPDVAAHLLMNLDGSPRSVEHKPLSNREYFVLQRIAAGLPLNHIARELGVSPQTVSTYRGRILKKTGMRSNAELISYVLRSQGEEQVLLGSGAATALGRQAGEGS